MRFPVLWFLLVGAASGILAAAAATFFQLGDIAAPWLFGRCFGLQVLSSCNGIDGAFYLFPGLVFGIVFAGVERWRGRFDGGIGSGFVIAALIGNALAVFVCVALSDPFSSAIDIATFDLPIALAGGIAGAVGGAVLAGATALFVPGTDPRPAIAVGAGLGLFVPLVTEWQVAGVFVFYIAWQAGVAAALGATLPDALSSAQGNAAAA
jgi:hypothetical protein